MWEQRPIAICSPCLWTTSTQFLPHILSWGELWRALQLRGESSYQEEKKPLTWTLWDFVKKLTNWISMKENIPINITLNWKCFAESSRSQTIWRLLVVKRIQRIWQDLIWFHFLMEDSCFGFEFMGTIGGPTPECLMICPELYPHCSLHSNLQSRVGSSVYVNNTCWCWSQYLAIYCEISNLANTFSLNFSSIGVIRAPVDSLPRHTNGFSAELPKPRC